MAAREVGEQDQGSAGAVGMHAPRSVWPVIKTGRVGGNKEARLGLGNPHRSGPQQRPHSQEWTLTGMYRKKKQGFKIETYI